MVGAWGMSASSFLPLPPLAGGFFSSFFFPASLPFLPFAGFSVSSTFGCASGSGVRPSICSHAISTDTSLNSGVVGSRASAPSSCSASHSSAVMSTSSSFCSFGRWQITASRYRGSSAIGFPCSTATIRLGRLPRSCSVDCRSHRSLKPTSSEIRAGRYGLVEGELGICSGGSAGKVDDWSGRGWEKDMVLPGAMLQSEAILLKDKPMWRSWALGERSSTSAIWLPQAFTISRLSGRFFSTWIWLPVRLICFS
mmetsp:Transcript_109254/g.185508  ORF Transcript_109254/g.185508 Transcript_109254/m.185508 type:complete len:253 (-) Transcript_109254:215-973(-)